jgi:hypothetical protein
MFLSARSGCQIFFGPVSSLQHYFMKDGEGRVCSPTAFAADRRALSPSAGDHLPALRSAFAYAGASAGQ